MFCAAENRPAVILLGGRQVLVSDPRGLGPFRGLVQLAVEAGAWVLEIHLESCTFAVGVRSDRAQGVAQILSEKRGDGVPHGGPLGA